MDNFYELLLTTKKSFLYRLVKTSVYIFVVIALAMFPFNFLISIFLVAIAVGAFFGKRYLYVEYEYEFTNGEIDIDKIMEMEKRKRVLSFSIKDVELLAEEKSHHVKDFSNKPQKEITCLPTNYDGRIYVAMLTGGVERVIVRFAPDDKFVDLCYKYNPRVVKKY